MVLVMMVMEVLVMVVEAGRGQVGDGRRIQGYLAGPSTAAHLLPGRGEGDWKGER